MILIKYTAFMLLLVYCGINAVKLKLRDGNHRRHKRYNVYEPDDMQATLANKIIAQEEAKEKQHVFEALSMDSIYTGDNKGKSVEDISNSQADLKKYTDNSDDIKRESPKFQNPVTRDHLKGAKNSKKDESKRELESIGFEEDSSEAKTRAHINKIKKETKKLRKGKKRDQEYPEFNVHHVGMGPFQDNEGRFHSEADSRENSMDGEGKGEEGMEEELRDQDDDNESEEHHHHSHHHNQDGRPQPHHPVGLRPNSNEEGKRRTMHGQIDSPYIVPAGNVQRGIQPDQGYHMDDVRHIDRLQHEVGFPHKLIGDHDDSDDEYILHNRHRVGGVAIRDEEYEHDDDGDDDDEEGDDRDEDDDGDGDGDGDGDDDVENSDEDVQYQTGHTPNDGDTGNFEKVRVEDGAVVKQSIPKKRERLVSEDADEKSKDSTVPNLKEKPVIVADDEDDNDSENKSEAISEETSQNDDDKTTKIVDGETTNLLAIDTSKDGEDTTAGTEAAVNTEEKTSPEVKATAEKGTPEQTIENDAVKESSDEENVILKEEQVQGPSVVTARKKTISALDSYEHEAKFDVPPEAIYEAQNHGLESVDNGDHIEPGMDSYHIHHQPNHMLQPLHDYTGEESHFYNRYTNPCENGGFFVPVTRKKHVCICLEKFMGKNCEDVNYCYNRPCKHCGKCMMTHHWPHYKCECCLKYSGKHCEVRNPCEPNPCINNGECTHDGHTPSCICKEKFKGEFCEDVNKCLPNPCLNNAVCIERPGVGTFQCLCKPGWLGTLCEVPSQCAGDPCRNGGTCQEAGRKFNCICPDGYIGDTCQRKLCYPNPCGNGGTCVEDGRNYHCMCPGWSKGDRCTDISPCLMNPCENGGRCIDAYSGFRWTLGTMQYYCMCQPPFHGPHCETNPCLYCDAHAHCDVVRCVCDDGYAGDGITCHKIPLPCHPNPCQNNGICVDEGHGFYHCHCKPPYLPPNCELPSYCHPNPCHGGTCIPLKNGFKCIECPDGFNGKTCGVTDLCSPNPCQHGGKCNHTSESTFGCTCDPEKDWIGDLCEKCSCRHSINPLVPSAFCHHKTGKCACPDRYNINERSGLCQKKNESTTRACIPNPCLCGGTCRGNEENPSDVTSFTCECPKQCYGDKCQNRHFCFQFNPCANGGTCIDLDGMNYRCNCPPGYSSQNCTILPTVTPPVNPCAENPCHNSGVCLRVGSSYDCKCLTRYTGPTCNIDRCKDCDEHAKCFAGECVCHRGYVGNGYSCVKECGGKCLDIEICSSGVCDCMGGYHRVQKVCTRIRDPADYYTHPTHQPTKKRHSKKPSHDFLTPIAPTLPATHAFVTHFTKPTVKTSVTESKSTRVRPTEESVVSPVQPGSDGGPTVPVVVSPKAPKAPTIPASGNAGVGAPGVRHYAPTVNHLLPNQKSKLPAVKKKDIKAPNTVDYKLLVVSENDDDIGNDKKPLVVNKKESIMKVFHGEKFEPVKSKVEQAQKKQGIRPTASIDVFAGRHTQNVTTLEETKGTLRRLNTSITSPQEKNTTETKQENANSTVYNTTQNENNTSRIVTQNENASLLNNHNNSTAFNNFSISSTKESIQNMSLTNSSGTTSLLKNSTGVHKETNTTSQRKERIQYLFRNPNKSFHSNHSIVNSTVGQKNSTNSTNILKKRSRTGTSIVAHSNNFKDNASFSKDDDDDEDKRSRIIDVLKGYGEDLGDEIYELTDDKNIDTRDTTV